MNTFHVEAIFERDGQAVQRSNGLSVLLKVGVAFIRPGKSFGEEDFGQAVCGLVGDGCALAERRDDLYRAKFARGHQCYEVGGIIQLGDFQLLLRKYATLFGDVQYGYGVCFGVLGGLFEG